MADIREHGFPLILTNRHRFKNRSRYGKPTQGPYYAPPMEGLTFKSINPELQDGLVALLAPTLVEKKRALTAFRPGNYIFLDGTDYIPIGTSGYGSVTGGPFMDNFTGGHKEQYVEGSANSVQAEYLHGSSTLSCFSHWYVGITGQNGIALGLGDTEAGGNSNFGINSSNLLGCGLVTSTGSGQVTDTPGSVTGWHTLCVTWETGIALKMWTDDNAYNTGDTLTGTFQLDSTNPENGRIVFFNTPDGQAVQTRPIAVTAVWNRCFEGELASELTRNPGYIYQQPTFTHYFYQPAIHKRILPARRAAMPAKQMNKPRSRDVEVNPASGLSRGLTAAYLFDENHRWADLVHGEIIQKYGTTTGTTTPDAIHGIGYRGDGSAVRGEGLNPNEPHTDPEDGPFTVLAVYTLYTEVDAGTTQVVGRGNGFAGGVRWAIAYWGYNDADADSFYFEIDDNTNLRRAFTSSDYVVVGRPEVLVGRYDPRGSGSVDLFANGTKFSTAGTISTLAGLNGEAIRVHVQKSEVDSTYGEYGDGSIQALYFWKRALSDAEVQNITDNPWQIFRPRRSFYTVPQVATNGLGVDLVPTNPSYKPTPSALLFNEGQGGRGAGYGYAGTGLVLGTTRSFCAWVQVERWPVSVNNDQVAIFHSIEDEVQADHNAYFNIRRSDANGGLLLGGGLEGNSGWHGIDYSIQHIQGYRGWWFAAYTYDGSNHYMYTSEPGGNGVVKLVDTLAQTDTVRTRTFNDPGAGYGCLRTIEGYTDVAFSGRAHIRLAHLMVWDGTALSREDFQTISRTHNPLSRSTLALWLPRPTDGETVIDQSGNGHHHSIFEPGIVGREQRPFYDHVVPRQRPMRSRAHFLPSEDIGYIPAPSGGFVKVRRQESAFGRFLTGGGKS